MEEHKTFTVPTMAIDNDVPVNLRNITHFAKLDPQDVRNAQNNSSKKKPEYAILFFTDLVGKQGNALEWNYSDKDCRDKEFQTLIDIFSVPLIPNN